MAIITTQIHVNDFRVWEKNNYLFIFPYKKGKKKCVKEKEGKIGMIHGKNFGILLNKHIFYFNFEVGFVFNFKY